MPRQFFLNLAALILRAALKAATPHLRKVVETKVKEIVDTAHGTESLFDDAFAEMLADLLEVAY